MLAQHLLIIISLAELRDERFRLRFGSLRNLDSLGDSLNSPF